MAWKDLSITEKSNIISEYLDAGYSSLKEIKELYNNSPYVKGEKNLFDGGGELKDYRNNENLYWPGGRLKEKLSSIIQKAKNTFTQATLRAAMADRPEIMQASGWNYDKDGNIVQGDFNAEGPTKLRESLSEIASMPLLDMGLGVAAGAIQGTKTYKAFKLAKEINNAVKSGAIESNIHPVQGKTIYSNGITWSWPSSSDYSLTRITDNFDELTSGIKHGNYEDEIQSIIRKAGNKRKIIHGIDDYALKLALEHGEKTLPNPSLAVYEERGVPFVYGDLTFIGDKNALDGAILFKGDGMTPTVATAGADSKLLNNVQKSELMRNQLFDWIKNGQSEKPVDLNKFLEQPPFGYDEVKHIYPFDLKRFKYAVVPEDLSPELKELIRNEGIETHFYKDRLNKQEMEDIVDAIFNNDIDLKFKKGGNLFKIGGLKEGIQKLFAPTYDTETFGEAFRQARTDNKDFFKWNGERYSTEMLPTVYVKDTKLKIPGVTRKQLNTMQHVWDYLRNNNVSARNAAAVMGNIMQESAFNTATVQEGGDSAVGLFQMHGQRLNDYKSYLKEKVLEDSMDNQLGYMIDVMRGKRQDFYMNEYNRVKDSLDSLKAIESPSASQKKALDVMQSYYDDYYKKRAESNRLFPISDFTKAFEDEAVSIEDLTDLFTNTIERAGKPEYKKRQDYAKNIYNYFYGVPTIQKTQNE